MPVLLAAPVAGPADVVVYDVVGRRVRILHHGFLAVGRHRIAWDGTRSSGERVAAGVYFVRAEGKGFEQTRKVVLLP